MALGFRTGGMFGRKPSYERQPWDTPGIGDGVNQRMAEMGDVNPSAMPIGIKEMTAKPKFFGQGGVGRAIAGSIGDFLLQQSGMQPIYGPTVLQQRDAEERARMAQQQRMQRREDMQWEWQNKPKDVNPYRWESNDGSLLEIGPDGQPRVVYKDPTPKTTYITSDNGDGTKTIVPIVNGVPQMGGQQPLIPIGGTLPPKGGSGGNVTGGFRR
jgi:hypothetical protein